MFLHVKICTAPLRIETGRYERLPVEQRVCEVCDSDNVEDEMHFSISCNAFFYSGENKIVFPCITVCW